MIRRLEILHYKAFKYIDIQLEPFQIIVGPNASGKSTFFDTICLIHDILREGPQNAIQKRVSHFKELLWRKEGEQFEIALQIKIPEEIQKQLKDDEYNTVRYEMSLHSDTINGISIQDENLWLIKKGSENIHRNGKKERDEDLFPQELKAPDHIVVSRRKKTPPGWRKVISKNAPGSGYFKSETTEWNIIYKIGPYKASLAGTPEDEERFPVSLWLKNVLMEGIQFLQLNSNNMRVSCRPDVPISFQTDGSNLPKVIQNLKEKNPKAFTLWLEHIQSALPEVQDIQIRERMEDRFLYLSIIHKNGLELPSWVISDGTLRILAQTIIPYLSEKDKIYMIEEPENGLHPLAIECIYQSLSSVYKSQVFLATHSPAILNLAELKEILCFSKTESGCIDVIKGINHPKLKDWREKVDIASLHAAGVLQ
ncbi:MAG TPA: AAA family ATPase [Candidatus Hydrogenedens sp.]|nr:AAA family ATPase [Candidatus Hydrogenedens sp.]HOL19409.1 AAA family ATPase [Candidatus Hydrogenedens sp.]HPP58238.1 AAA family ATPase [Candidatus Hydrogenedens sp.]